MGRSVGMTRAEQFAASFAHRTTRAVQRGASGAVLDSLGSAIGAVEGCSVTSGSTRRKSTRRFGSFFAMRNRRLQQLLLGMGQGKICARMRWNALDSGTFWAQSRSDRKSGVATARKSWWAGTGLNRRHQDFQSCALPTELPAHQRREDSRRARGRPLPAVHSDGDLERTVQAYERAFQAMVAEGAFKSA